MSNEMLDLEPKFSVVEESENLPVVEPSLHGGRVVLLVSSWSCRPRAFSAAESKVKRLGILAAAWLNVVGLQASKEGSGGTAFPIIDPAEGKILRKDGDLCWAEGTWAKSPTRSSLEIEISESFPLLMRFISLCCTERYLCS